MGSDERDDDGWLDLRDRATALPAHVPLGGPAGGTRYWWVLRVLLPAA
ncbi:hypothetical protein [Jannaschia sp. R86511]